jgi:hypothetical protein
MRCRGLSQTVVVLVPRRFEVVVTAQDSTICLRWDSKAACVNWTRLFFFFPLFHLIIPNRALF